MKRLIRLKDRDVYYYIVEKKKKNISIKINKDGELIIYSPIGISCSYIQNLLLEKQEWIIKNIDNIKNNYYNNNNKVVFLGNEYIKKVELSNIDKIYIDKNSIYIKSKVIDENYINKIIKEWYINQADIVLNSRVKELSKKNNLIPSKIIIKDQKSRWGSCNSKKEIRLNWRLILMPYDIIDYIIVHELCHLKQMNHSKAFWCLVEGIIPNFKDAEKWLKCNGRLIILN